MGLTPGPGIELELRRACPSCGRGRAARLIPLRWALYDGCPLASRVDLVACPGCGFVFYETPSPPADYEAYYASFSSYAAADRPGAGGLSPDERRRHLETVEVVHRHRPEPEGRIVDVGCARGGLLELLDERGLGPLVGVDLLPANVARVQARLGAGAARLGSAARLPLSDGSVSVAVVSHVLEHVHDLGRALAELARVLVDGGLLYAEVPSADRYPSYPAAPRWDLLYEHLNHFDATQLDNVLRTAGFEELERGRKRMAVGCAGGRCLYSVLRKTGRPAPPVADHGLRRRLAGTLTLEAPPAPALAGLAARGDPAHVWGLSSYMLLQLAEGSVARCNVVGLLDGDTFKQTWTVGGLKVEPPAVLERPGAVRTVLLPTGPYLDGMRAHLAAIGFAGDVVVV